MTYTSLALEGNSSIQLKLARQVGSGRDLTEVGGIDIRSRCGKVDRIRDVEYVRRDGEFPAFINPEFPPYTDRFIDQVGYEQTQGSRSRQVSECVRSRVRKCPLV